MPNLDGIAMISKLKKEFSNVKTIAMSAGGEMASGGEYLDSAERVFDLPTISKPIDNAQMLKLIKQVLSA